MDYARAQELEGSFEQAWELLSRQGVIHEPERVVYTEGGFDVASSKIPGTRRGYAVLMDSWTGPQPAPLTRRLSIQVTGDAEEQGALERFLNELPVRTAAPAQP